MTSSVQPVNELVRPVEQGNSNAFAIMAVPERKMADSFHCQNRHLPERTPTLKPSDVKYGTYYRSANRLNYGEEESPALLLLWTREKDQWKVVAWAVEVPQVAERKLSLTRNSVWPFSAVVRLGSEEIAPDEMKAFVNAGRLLGISPANLR